MGKQSRIQADACMDCPAGVTVIRGQGATGDPLLIVTVTHDETCPWFAPGSSATTTARRCPATAG